MKEYDYKLTKIFKDGLFYIEITQLSELFEVFIWHEDYGDKMHCFGVETYDFTFDEVVLIVEANLWNYKHLYATRYMDRNIKEGGEEDES